MTDGFSFFYAEVRRLKALLNELKREHHVDWAAWLMVGDFLKLILALVKGQVKFVIVGGIAAVVHGSARATFDLDVVYSRSDDNIKKLISALKPHSPYLRDVPQGLPFSFDEVTVRNGLNFTLTTNLGSLDLFGEMAGGGGYDALRPHSQEINIFGVKCRCLGLSQLIHVKRAAGRPKDLEAIAELQAILEEKQKQS